MRLTVQVSRAGNRLCRPSTDIYSLAKIVIEMLTGRRLSDLLPNAAMDLSARVREQLAGLPI